MRPDLGVPLRESVHELGLAGAAALCAAVLVAIGALAPLERPVADAALALAARRPPTPPASAPGVAVVAIDPQSLRALPEWPWPRRFYADAVTRLDAAGAVAIAFDVDFSTPRDPADDAAFAAAVAASGRVVLASFRQFQDLGGAELEIASLPIPRLARGAAAIGSVMVPVDADGVVRRSPRAIDVAGAPTVSLAEAALDVATAQASRPRVGETFAIDYRRQRPAIPLLSMSDVLDGRFDPRDVAGRVVMVGATAAELQDLWPTPLDPAAPGVLIQAVAFRTLAAERAGEPVLRRAGQGVRLAAIALLALAAGRLSGARGSHGRRVVRLAALATGVVGGSAALLLQTGWWLDPVAPCAVVALQYVLGLEVVRSRIGRQVAEQESSLAAVFRIGEASTGVTSDGGLELGLHLLGEVVGASGVALYRARPDGVLDGRRLAWSPEGGPEAGDLDLAAEVFAGSEPRVFEGRIPGRDAAPGVAVYAPLHAGELPVGVLVVERAGSAALEPVQLRTVATVGAQIALSAGNLRLVEDLRRSFETSVEAIASAIEARDGYTEMHCRRLAIFSTTMAARLGLAEEEIESIRLGALLHDVGKIGIRDEILLKPGSFTPEERRVMESHTEVGERIVQPISGITCTTLGCIRHHHERWDGRGYPDGLAGETIPLGARIVTVVDVWDALSSARPYKPAFPQERVLELLHKGRGTEFDPDVVDLFFRVLDEEGEEMLALVGMEAADPA